MYEIKHALIDLLTNSTKRINESFYKLPITSNKHILTDINHKCVYDIKHVFIINLLIFNGMFNHWLT